MIQFMRLSDRSSQEVAPRRALPNWLIALLLALILCLQIALLLLIS
jgi:hypothetical protein